ncbi:hypothetical protein HND97_11415 [Vibrio cholerae]|nr:hypothetical protein HND97_11415 [Vibrio cholerae]
MLYIVFISINGFYYECRIQTKSYTGRAIVSLFGSQVVSFITYNNVSSALREDKTKLYGSMSRRKKKPFTATFVKKITSLEQIAEFNSQNSIPEDKVNFVKQLAAVAIVGSVVFTEHNGKGYWNQTATDWPEHVFEGDATTGEW